MARIQKTIRVMHAEPGDFRLGFILLPIGYAYNVPISQAKKGDILRLADGGDYPIFNVLRLKVTAPVTRILCQVRYGITIEGAMMRWRNNAKLEGHGAKAISDDECLLVTYETDPV